MSKIKIHFNKKITRQFGKILRVLLNSSRNVTADAQQVQQLINLIHQRKYYDFFRGLIHVGADIESKKALIIKWVFRKGTIDTVNLILDEIESTDENNEYLLDRAIFYGRLDIIEIILKRKKDILNDNTLALVKSIKAGYEEVTEYFIDSGIDINKISKMDLLEGLPAKHKKREPMLKLIKKYRGDWLSE